MLRWKKNARPTGLARVGAGPSGSTLRKDGSIEVARVMALRHNYATTGWFWVAASNSGIPYYNSCDKPVKTEEEAKLQAVAYVKKHIAADQTKEGPA